MSCNTTAIIPPACQSYVNTVQSLNNFPLACGTAAYQSGTFAPGPQKFAACCGGEDKVGTYGTNGCFISQISTPVSSIRLTFLK